MSKLNFSIGTDSFSMEKFTADLSISNYWSMNYFSYVE